LRRPYRLLHDIYVLLDDGDRQMLDRFGLNPTQYSLLAMLQCGEGQRLTLLSRRLLLSKSTITRVVDQLERLKLVRRLGEAGDRRAQRVVLTDSGLRVQGTITAGHDRSLHRRMAVLTPAEREQLDMLLAKLRQGLIADLGRDGHGSL